MALIAGTEKPKNFFRRERLSGQVFDVRHLHALGGVVRDPFTVQAPRKKDTQDLQFLAPGAGDDRPLLAVSAQEDRIDLIQGNTPVQVVQRRAVDLNSGFLNAAPPAVVQESRNGGGDGAGFFRFGLDVNRVTAGFDHLHDLLGAGAVRRVEGLPEALPVDDAVSPDRALAQGEGLPLLPMWAGFQVPPVGLQHDRIVAGLWYTEFPPCTKY